MLPGSLVLCVGIIAALPGTASGFTYLALVAVPPLAVLALAWGSSGLCCARSPSPARPTPKRVTWPPLR